MKTRTNPERNSDCFVSGLLQCAVAAAFLVAVNTAGAQDWTFDPVLRVGYEYDDNAPLDSNPQSNDEAQGYLLEGEATIGYATQRTTFDLIPRIISRNYDEERFDSDDGFLDLNWHTQGLKSNFRVRARYSEESVRTAEREDADPTVNDPDEITNDDAGRIFASGEQNRIWVLPQWDYDISEKTTIGASASYTDVDYDNILPGSYIPFTDTRFDMWLMYGLSPRTRAFIRAVGGRYENEIQQVGLAKEVDGIGASIGIDRGLTETVRFRAEVGITETEPDTGQSDTDSVWDFHLIRNLETTTMLAQVKRSVGSDGTGRVSIRDSFNLRMTKQFSDRVEGGLGVVGYTTDQLSSETGLFDERDYAQIHATMSYAITQTFLIEGDYRYTFLDRSIFPDSAKSNSIAIWFAWAPTAARTSR